MILTSSLNFGIKRTIPLWLGIITGVPLMMSLIGLGLGQIFIWWPGSFLILKLIGCAYLFYLAIKIALSSSTDKNINKQPMSYWQGFLFQWINPKAWVMSIGAMATFSTHDATVLQVLTITSTFLWVGCLGVGCWLFAGFYLQQLLQNPNYRRVFNLSMALILLATIWPILQSSIKSALQP
ncbi:MAG: LysE family translocator [Pseudomonadales bacterium]|nr:LysE family translocator [Pseudomonadales bacterium]